MHCCATDQFINCAAFDELRNIWSLVKRNCNRVVIRAKSMVRVGARIRVSFGVRARLGSGLRLRNWPNAQHVLSNMQLDQMRLTATQSVR